MTGVAVIQKILGMLILKCDKETLHGVLEKYGKGTK
jgi:hypothetical protein